MDPAQVEDSYFHAKMNLIESKINIFSATWLWVKNLCGLGAQIHCYLIGAWQVVCNEFTDFLV